MHDHSNQQAVFTIEKRNRIRKKGRGFYQKQAVYDLIDTLKLGHVAFVQKDQIFSIPFTVWRVDEYLYLHCANKARLHKHLQAGGEVCISFARANEWVLTKSALEHSVNYDSVVVFCHGQRVEDPADFDHAFRDIINSIEPERWNKLRPPNDKERKMTALMRLSIDSASLKHKSAEPTETEEDQGYDVWHGTVPVCPYGKEGN